MAFLIHRFHVLINIFHMVKMYNDVLSPKNHLYTFSFQVLNQSLALAGLGRGRPVNQPVLDSSLPSGSTNSSASSVTSSPSRSTESPGREYCMLGRGRGRGRAMAKNISTGPPVGITPLGQNHGK